MIFCDTSTLAKYERGWRRNAFLTVVRQFTTAERSGFWTWISLDGTIVQQAARADATLPHDVRLRTADCLPLVTALQQGFSEIHTHDRHQCDGARAFGLEAVAIL
jgi:hypothetical protein